MLLILCTSGFHRRLAKEIVKNNRDKDCVILSVDKSYSIAGKLKNVILSFFYFFKVLICKDSHVIVPHPFNPWFALFILGSKYQSILDDGIAYYYDAKIPNRKRCLMYALIAKKLNRNSKLSNIYNMTYKDYLESSSASNYYCVYIDGRNKKLPRQIETRPRVGAEDYKSSGVIVFLDSSEEISSKISYDALARVLRGSGEQGAARRIYYKPHPRSMSRNSKLLAKEDWATELKGDYEEFLELNRVEALYSIYSSAIISTRIMQPATKIYCITNAEIRAVVSGIIELCEREKVDFIEL